jgi:hypothetical protein
MEKESKRKILGAFVVGLALVGGAYTLSNLQKPQVPQVATVTESQQAAPRVAITVSDQDNNGIEDWRDSFVTTEPVILDATIADYAGPETLTEELGVNFVQSVLEQKIRTGSVSADSALIADTIENLEDETSSYLYDVQDISIITNWTNEDVRNYANVMAGAIIDNNVEGLESELEILYDILDRGEEEKFEELVVLSGYYKTLRDTALSTPVPSHLVKEHLDLINTYYAIYLDIEAMQKSVDDPVVSLVRVRRYEDDARGLAYALQNMYIALLNHSTLFGPEDPAVIFNSFRPKQNI